MSSSECARAPRAREGVVEHPGAPARGLADVHVPRYQRAEYRPIGIQSDLADEFVREFRRRAVHRGDGAAKIATTGPACHPSEARSAVWGKRPARKAKIGP
ncbi:hypothetical protein OJF2_14990 [Aquisphaera giovannonii]|uniref:Uncharacterized protein n=1 Tax=Aquisphaera giovannonii TaxID=406548 RepID=A0A5B9VZ15_9BACT|nr:hypothetical protein OJF2_14990 [Aquisphaera giovannonii]